MPGGRRTHFMHGRTSVTVDLRIPAVPERSTSAGGILESKGVLSDWHRASAEGNVQHLGNSSRVELSYDITKYNCFICHLTMCSARSSRTVDTHR